MRAAARVYPPSALLRPVHIHTGTHTHTHIVGALEYLSGTIAAESGGEMERYDDSCCSTRRVNEREITPPLPYRAYIVYKHTRAPNQCVCTYACIYTQSERERERYASIFSERESWQIK